MKNTKLIIAGLTAVLTLSGASAVFAEDTTDGWEQSIEKEGMRSESFRRMEMDMSGLDLPEDFVPFDEAHVPDGKNIPENGELKPIEFDEEGNMMNGQLPPMWEETEGQRPESEEGNRPEFAEGRRPAFPGSELSGMNGERPELPDGEMPMMNGERPELPDGEMPGISGERPELPDGEMPAMNGERPELPEDMMSAFTEGETQKMPQSSMPFGGRSPQTA